MIAPFVLHQPRSLPDALALLSEHAGDARILAGGSELLLLLKMGVIAAEHIVDIFGLCTPCAQARAKERDAD